MDLLEVKNLQVCFHTAIGTATAVRNVSFSVKEGEVLGIVGESGSGKSVTSLAVLGLLDKGKNVDISGEIIYQGKNLLELSEKEMCKIRGKELSMIFQEPGMALNPVKKVETQLKEVYKIHMPEKLSQADDDMLRLLEKLNIPDAQQVLKKYPFELSGGIKQRIMIAMAMISNPKVLIADEPTTALDVTTQAEILELLNTIKKETNCAIILITHDLGVIAELADKIVVMYRGEIVEKNEIKDFYQEPLHPYSMDLLKARPRNFNGTFYSIPGTIPNAYQKKEGCGYCERCVYATDACKERTPDLQAMKEEGWVRCHRFGEKENDNH